MEAPIELKYWLENPNSTESMNECSRVSQILERTGCLVIRDPRISESDNNTFLDALEKYFEQDYETKMADARPEFHYQLGVTPEGIECPRCTTDPACHEIIKKLGEIPGNGPQLPSKPDPKWRYFHRIGQQPPSTNYTQLNAIAISPKKFPNFLEILETWGVKLLATSYSICEMAAIGFGLPSNAFTDMMIYGPHLIAPTGSDLSRYNHLNQILAGFHCDLNLITLHGKSRFPGLNIWMRDGTKLPVSIEDGCLFAQAGMELEHVTGGKVMAGWHEVIITDSTLKAVQRAKHKKKSLWRVSSTLFAHVSSDRLLPVMVGDPEERARATLRYPLITAGKHVENELSAINLKKN